jgi:hypothetical protein
MSQVEVPGNHKVKDNWMKPERTKHLRSYLMVRFLEHPSFSSVELRVIINEDGELIGTL